MDPNYGFAIEYGGAGKTRLTVAERGGKPVITWAYNLSVISHPFVLLNEEEPHLRFC